MANKSKKEIQKEAEELLIYRRQIEGARMRTLGYPAQKIAEKQGISREQVRRDLAALFARTKAEGEETIEEMRERENDRLDILQSAIAAQVLKGDVSAGTLWVRLAERRSRLNGIDRPVMFEGADGSGGVVIIPGKVMSLEDWAEEARRITAADAAAFAEEVKESNS